MLQLTRLSGARFALNPDLIERAEATPDTHITLVNGTRYVVAESLDELIAAMQAHRVAIIVAAQRPTGPHLAHDESTPHHSGLASVTQLHSKDR